MLRARTRYDVSPREPAAVMRVSRVKSECRACHACRHCRGAACHALAATLRQCSAARVRHGKMPTRKRYCRPPERAAAPAARRVKRLPPKDEMRLRMSRAPFIIYRFARYAPSYLCAMMSPPLPVSAARLRTRER